jgi:hypothetical protein
LETERIGLDENFKECRQEDYGEDTEGRPAFYEFYERLDRHLTGLRNPTDKKMIEKILNLYK